MRKRRRETFKDRSSMSNLKRKKLFRTGGKRRSIRLQHMLKKDSMSIKKRKKLLLLPISIINLELVLSTSNTTQLSHQVMKF